MKKIIIVDLFAGTFSVTKSILSFQKENPDVEICAIFSVEISRELCLNFLKSDFYKNSKENSDIKFRVYQADIFNKKATTQIKKEIVDFVKNSKDIYGILVFAGPPCNHYSSFNLLNVHQIDAKKFEKKQKKSEKLVLETIEISQDLQTTLSKEYKIDIVIENPWSFERINIPHKDDIFNELGFQYSSELALRFRPFFQQFLKENDGFLYTSKHFWCMYDFQNFSKKPTSIFSSLPNIESNKCNHKKHIHSIDKLKNAEIRGRWPDLFVQYCIKCFQTHENK